MSAIRGHTIVLAHKLQVLRMVLAQLIGINLDGVAAKLIQRSTAEPGLTCTRLAPKEHGRWLIDRLGSGECQHGDVVENGIMLNGGQPKLRLVVLGKRHLLSVSFLDTCSDCLSFDAQLADSKSPVC